jgi:hypothetical protein
VRALEDIALYDALERNGARIRHSLRVRVTTSARFGSRAPGGFGSRICEWSAGVLRAFIRSGACADDAAQNDLIA